MRETAWCPASRCAGCGDRATGRRSSPPEPASAGRRASGGPADSSTAGSLNSPRAGQLHELVVRDAAPQEERQPRGQVEVGDAVGGARTPRPPASRSTRNRNFGDTSSASTAHRMPSSKPSARVPARLEGGEERARCRRRSPAAGTHGARATRGSARRTAASSVSSCPGGTMKMARRLGRVRGRPSVEGTDDLDALHGRGVRVEREGEAGDRGRRRPPVDRQRSPDLLDEGSAQQPRAPAVTGMRTASGCPLSPGRRAGRVRDRDGSSSWCPARARPRRATRTTYSASSGKWCRTARPPRDPNGRSSLTRPTCESSGDVL